MKISVIVPVYNEEETIGECLEALTNQDYSKPDFEIIVVDDGSTDKTPQIVNKVLREARESGTPFKSVRSQEREGRALARLRGAEEANHDSLLFVDARCIAERDILKNIMELNYQPLVGNPLVKSYSSLSRFQWLVRRKVYRPYFGEKFESVYIERENFDRIGKGTGVFLCDKDLFLSAQPRNLSEHASDDTKLLWNIVQKQRILKHSGIRVTYLPRSSFRGEIKHTFQRGPKFVDYYLDYRKKRFWTIIVSPLFLLALTVSLLLINFTFFIYWLALLLSILILSSIPLSVNIKDFFIVLTLLPVMGIAFELGIWKGLALKIPGSL